MDRKRLSLYALFAGSVLIAFGTVCFAHALIAERPPTYPRLCTTTQVNQDAVGRHMPQPERRAANSYFAAKEQSLLVAENRVLIQSDDSALFGKSVVAALIKEVEREHTLSTPKALLLGAFYIVMAQRELEIPNIVLSY